jgi:hypothetical protein
MQGDGAPADALESLRLYWPAYFADRSTAPPMTVTGMSVAAYSGVLDSLVAELPRLEAALPHISVPVGVVVGAEAISITPSTPGRRRTAPDVARPSLKTAEAAKVPGFDRTEQRPLYPATTQPPSTWIT